MVSTNEFKTGLTIEYDGNLYYIVEFQHVKPGKGGAFVRSKLRNLRTGSVTDKTWRSGEKVKRARIERKEMQYLYNNVDEYHFMDVETFDQLRLMEDQLGDQLKYLKENIMVTMLSYDNETISVELPHSVELTVAETAPNFKGDTSSGGGKPATMETGLVVTVPFFIEVDDVLRIDTRTGDYLERL